MFDATITLLNGRVIELTNLDHEEKENLVQGWRNFIGSTYRNETNHYFPTSAVKDHYIRLDQITDIKVKEHLRDKLLRKRSNSEDLDDYIVQDGPTQSDHINKLYPVTLGHERNKIAVHRFRTVKAAENFIGHIAKDDPAGVDRGEYYIDAPEEMVNGC